MNNPINIAPFKRVLIIDDDEVNIYIAKRVINSISDSIEVLTKSCLEESLKYLKTTGSSGTFPGLILLDLNMPGQNGLEFLRQVSLLTQKENHSLTVALMANVINPKNSDLLRAKKYPFVKYSLEKPITQTVLEEIWKAVHNGK